MSDLLWSDPRPFNGVGPSKRGVGVAFGPDITAGFCDTNGLQCVVRSHEVKEEGYLVEHEGKCITVFSAPNYCDQMGNKGAYIRFTHDCKPEFNKFTHVVRCCATVLCVLARALTSCVAVCGCGCGCGCGCVWVCVGVCGCVWLCVAVWTQPHPPIKPMAYATSLGLFGL